MLVNHGGNNEEDRPTSGPCRTLTFPLISKNIIFNQNDVIDRAANLPNIWKSNQKHILQTFINSFENEVCLLSRHTHSTKFKFYTLSEHINDLKGGWAMIGRNVTAKRSEQFSDTTQKNSARKYLIPLPRNCLKPK